MVEVGDQPFPLAVEPTDEAHPAVTTKRDAERLDQLLEYGEQAVREVGMAVRIHVGGKAPREVSERLELTPELVVDGRQVGRVELALVLTPHIPVEADGEARVITA